VRVLVRDIGGGATALHQRGRPSLPRAGDIPPIEVTLDGSAPCRTNPLGAKGCGESGAIGGPPCITNGVMDALSELGIKTLSTPLTPMKVWQAIRDARAGV
jgi:carbon-monoxide dehydrogenase large subunit